MVKQKHTLFGYIVIMTILLIGFINFEGTLSRFESYRVFPITWFVALSVISLLFFLFILIVYLTHHRLTWIDGVIALMTFYPIVTSLFIEETWVIASLNPRITDINLIFEYTNLLRFQDVYYGMSVGLLMFLIGRVVMCFDLFKKLYTLVFFFGVVFILIESFYSLFMEWDDYVYAFENFNDGVRVFIQSFTSNPNIYAFHLSLGMYAIGTLMVTERKELIRYSIVYSFIFFLLILTVSKTSIFAMVFYTILLLILVGARLLRHRKVLQDLFVLVSIVSIATFAVMIFNIDEPFYQNLERLLTTSFVDSLDSRLDIYNTAVDLIQGNYLWVGFGLGTSNLILGLSLASRSSQFPFYTVTLDRFHNGIIELVFAYGMIGILLLSIATAYYLYKLYKQGYHALTIPLIAMMVSFIIHTSTEDRMFFRPDLGGVFFFTLCLLPWYNANLKLRISNQ
jgi:hypothetical protein